MQAVLWGPALLPRVLRGDACDQPAAYNRRKFGGFLFGECDGLIDLT